MSHFQVTIPGLVKIIKSAGPKQVGTSDTTVYTVTSGRTFYATGVIVTNPVSGSDATVYLYDGPSTNGKQPILPLYVKEKTVEKIDEAVLKGAPQFLSSIVAYSTLSGVWVQVIGYEG